MNTLADEVLSLLFVMQRLNNPGDVCLFIIHSKQIISTIQVSDNFIRDLYVLHAFMAEMCTLKLISDK